MEFIHPYWLFGLLAVAVPVIIHLFNFRRYRKYYFTNLKLLKSIKRETRKQHRLRHLLVLISRILAIIFLVLAFARPYFPGPQGLQKAEVNMVSIYVDNSMSMQAAVKGHRLLDEAIAKASEVALAYNHSDRFQLITNDFKGKHQPYYNRDEFLKLLDEIRVSPATRMTGEVYSRMKELSEIRGTEKLHFYILSDFQRSTTELNALAGDTSVLVFLMPLLPASLPNVYIDSCWHTSPFNHIQQQQEVNISLTNASETDLEKIPVRLSINGNQRGLASFDIKAGGRAEVKLPFTNREAGIHSAEISIDDYPISWDDKLYLSWTAKGSIPVLSISDGEAGFYLRSLFSSDSVFNYYSNDIKRLDYSKFSEVDFIVMDNIAEISSGLASELKRYVEGGGSLLLLPDGEADISSLNMFMQMVSGPSLQVFDTTLLQVTGINSDHEIFEGVFESVPENIDLPRAAGHFPLSGHQQGQTEVIMDLQNTDPFLTVTRHAQGKVYLLSSAAGDETGNIVRHALWVPLAYRMAMLSRPQDQLYYVVGEDNSIRTARMSLTGDQSFIMKLSGSEFEFIPGYRAGAETAELFIYDQITQAGHYDLFDGEAKIATYSYNYDRKESAPAIYDRSEITEMTEVSGFDNVFIVESSEGAVSESVITFNQGRELWKLFIWLGLFFILMEILLLRLFRK